MSRYSNVADLLLITAVTISGYVEAPWIVMPVAAGALAAGSIRRFTAKARAKPHIDSRPILRKLSITAMLYAIAAVIAAYLLGLAVGRFNLP